MRCICSKAYLIEIFFMFFMVIDGSSSYKCLSLGGLDEPGVTCAKQAT